MSKEIVDIIVEGGKASAGPQMGQAFGPLGVNIQGILDKINEKTSGMKGMKIPVKVIVDTETKEFELELGSPPISELIKKELGIEKGSGSAKLDKVGNLAVEQIVKIAKVKKDSMLVNNLKSAVKSVIGSCGPLGILVEGKEPKEIIEDINKGIYDNTINNEITEVTEEKKEILDKQLEEIKTELSKKIVEVEEKEEAPSEENGEGEEKEEEEKSKGKVLNNKKG